MIKNALVISTSIVSTAKELHERSLKFVLSSTLCSNLNINCSYFVRRSSLSRIVRRLCCAQFLFTTSEMYINTGSVINPFPVVISGTLCTYR